MASPAASPYASRRGGRVFPVWLASRSQRNTPHSSPKATTTPVTGFCGRVSPVFPDVFYGCGGHRRGAVCRRLRATRPRPMQYSIVFVGADKGGARSPLRRGDSSFSVRRSEVSDRRLVIVIQHMLRLCQVRCCLNRGLRGFRDWRDCPARLSRLTLTLALSRRGRGDVHSHLLPGHPPLTSLRCSRPLTLREGGGNDVRGMSG